MRPWEDELDALARVLGLSEAEHRRLIGPARRNPKLRATVERLLRLRVLRESLDPDDLPAFGALQELPDGDIGRFFVLLGNQRRGEFGIPLGGAEGHLGVFGQTGSGKSTLIRDQIIIPAIESGLACWIFDTEAEHQVLIRVFDASRLLVLDPPRCSINPFQAFGDPVQWAGHLGNVFRQTQFCRDGSENLLTQITISEYLRRGVLEGSEDHPCIADIYHRVKALRYHRESRIRQFSETLENRSLTLMQQLRPGIMTVKSFDFPGLLNRSVLFRLHGLSGTTRDFFVTLMLTLFMVHRTGQSFERPRNLMILEEVQNYLG